MTRKITRLKQSEDKRKVNDSNLNRKFFLDSYPAWRFEYCDLDSKYSILNCKDSLFRKLKYFEKMTYKSLFFESVHQNHELKDRSKMLKFVEDKLQELGLDKDLNIYSLRLDSTTRIYGFIESNIFYILWYDQKHELYPVAKKHT